MRSDPVHRRRPVRGVGVPRRVACDARCGGAVPAGQILGVVRGADCENDMQSRRHDWG